MQVITKTDIADTLPKKLPRVIAVALSGGPDSMALLHQLCTRGNKTKIHAITIDHGLRTESASEAEQVGRWIQDWPGVAHHILRWTGKKPQTAIQERARQKRYDLMIAFCKEHTISQLYLAHHQTDQVETFLFRLAKGSGLDGLCGMKEVAQYRDSTVFLHRPFLSVPKTALESYCKAHNIPFVKDRSNENRDYARVRLRQSLPVLEAEGLSEKRLAVTAMRLTRAKNALDFYTEKLVRRAMRVEKGRVVFDAGPLLRAPEEIRLRAIRRGLAVLGAEEHPDTPASGGNGYGPRLERLEELLSALFADSRPVRTFTLGGFLFSYKVRAGVFVIAREKTARSKT